MEGQKPLYFFAKLINGLIWRREKNNFSFTRKINYESNKNLRSLSVCLERNAIKNYNFGFLLYERFETLILSLIKNLWTICRL